ncbi:MAG TPA: bacillithiol system redox-active protein YtxJ [Chitinophagaceae bacterium]|nr:bacillithiol system redox-active protein YtxJ [Chitinophagaceae bacterium]
MQWIDLNDSLQFKQILEESQLNPILIFKHSTRCSISHMAKARLERTESPLGLPFYYLDLLRYREISNQISDTLQVAHESPQVLLIHHADCVYDESHSGIDMQEIHTQFIQLTKKE